ncbi:tyrosine-type recombinase/integrase [Saliniradius amylolyticus]|nr:tyrosine-type recombinase/integrase [Saliniradius amylolyticus]
MDISKLEPVVHRWLDYKLMNEGKSARTVDKYAGYLLRLQNYLDKPLLEAERDDLVNFTGLHLHSEGFKPRSRRAVVAAVRGFYAWCLKNQHISQDPARDLEYPKSGQRLPTSMSLSHAEKLLMQPDIATFTGVRDAAILALMMGCGFRMGGITALNDSNLIWYKHQDKDRLAIRVIEKGDKERVIPVPVEAMLLLQAYLGHRELHDIDRLLENGDRVLFVSTGNRLVPACDYRGEERRLSARSIDKFIKRYAEDAGIPNAEAHAHALRHLVGTELAEESATSFEIQSILGHADPKTSQTYIKLAVRKLTDVLDKANPLEKLNTPISPLAKEFKRAL